MRRRLRFFHPGWLLHISARQPLDGTTRIRLDLLSGRQKRRLVLLCGGPAGVSSAWWEEDIVAAHHYGYDENGDDKRTRIASLSGP